MTFEHYSYIQPLRFADSEQIKRGNFVIALGNPAGPEYHGSATFGIISSSKLRYIDDDISWTKAIFNMMLPLIVVIVVELY